jgi:hypothetical protein
MPQEDLIAAVMSVLSDPARDASFSDRLHEDLARLAKSLPADLLVGRDGFLPDDPAWLAEILDQAPAFLAARLSPSARSE